MVFGRPLAYCYARDTQVHPTWYCATCYCLLHATTVQVMLYVNFSDPLGYPGRQILNTLRKEGPIVFDSSSDAIGLYSMY